MALIGAVEHYSDSAPELWIFVCNYGLESIGGSLAQREMEQKLLKFVPQRFKAHDYLLLLVAHLHLKNLGSFFVLSRVLSPVLPSIFILNSLGLPFLAALLLFKIAPRSYARPFALQARLFKAVFRREIRRKFLSPRLACFRFLNALIARISRSIERSAAALSTAPVVCAVRLVFALKAAVFAALRPTVGDEFPENA